MMVDDAGSTSYDFCPLFRVIPTSNVFEPRSEMERARERERERERDDAIVDSDADTYA